MARRFRSKSGLVARFSRPSKRLMAVIKAKGAAWQLADLPFHKWAEELQAAVVFLEKVWGASAATAPLSRKNARKLGALLLHRKNGRYQLALAVKFAKGKERLLWSMLNRPKFLVLALSMSLKELDTLNIKSYRDLVRIQKAIEAGAPKDIPVEILRTAAEYAHLADFEPEDWPRYAKIWAARKPFEGKRIAGKVGNIEYEVLDDNDASALFLDDASDCCQGLDGAGEACMVDGITNPRAGFLVFRRRGKIFAQSWIRLLPFSKGILLDSIEFKGDYNDSFGKAVKAAIADLKSHYGFVAVGKSPNRCEIQFNRKKHPLAEKVCDWAYDQGIYSDAKTSVTII